MTGLLRHPLTTVAAGLTVTFLSVWWLHRQRLLDRAAMHIPIRPVI